MATVTVDNIRAHVIVEGPVEEVRFKSDKPRVSFALYFEGDERGKILHGDTFRLELIKTSSGDEAASAVAAAEIESITKTAEANVEARRSAGRKLRK
jgi:hypothetical protein